jgi:8-oxo-dGTP pyrophosphatase MutT (NUDIX family)
MNGPREGARGGPQLTTEGLGAVLLHPEKAGALNAPGGTDAAVLVALYDFPDAPGLVFTKRRDDLRRHAGEISFPGGRRDPEDADFVATALREANEEVGLDPAEVQIAGALPPVGTFVTGYKVHPIVAVIPPAPVLRPNPSEVEAVLLYSVEELRTAFGMRRLVRRGIAFRTPTYEMGEHLIWGATARILSELLDRLDT